MQRTINGIEYILIDEQGDGSCKDCAFKEVRITTGMVSCTELTGSTECRDLRKIYKRVE